MTARNPLPYFLAKTAFATSRAEHLGLSRSRMRASDLEAPFRGVRTAGLDLGELSQLCRAAAVFMSEREAFSHSTALGLWGAPLPPGLVAANAPLHIATPGTSRRRRRGVIGHRLSRSTRVVLSPDGLSTVAPATAWCQFASQRGHHAPKDWLMALVCVADHLITGRRSRGIREPPTCTPAELRAAVTEHGSGRGARLLAEALTLMRIGAESPKETELRLLLLDEGLGAPEVGYVIQTRIGARTPDLAYPLKRLLIEYEGDVHRENRRRWRSDFERVRAFQQSGWTVIRVNSDDLTDALRRQALIAQLRELLA